MPGGKNRTVTTIAMMGLAGIFVITLLATISFGLAGIWFVDVARSYTAGANYYSRYQKSAVLALLRYGDSRDEADFAAYRTASRCRWPTARGGFRSLIRNSRYGPATRISLPG
ncbi:MAG: hypothetical protein QUV20_01715 [Oceanibaculum nanhaiense]|uniref:hypothetical protein n=1 Tax=Oceanibaculum nanhaiense TaxID=1909734 RepID=UPI0025A4BB85|nr:hypothetical protein [Oceanibaculum nanhaiense]MDM7945024.1 hypothetical protein [Oceanibaculum nanhaiense]